MNYVKSLDMFGVPAKEIPCILGKGLPSDTTGAVGALYMDEDSGSVYKCTAVTDGVFVWVPFTGQGSIATVHGVAPDAHGNVNLKVIDDLVKAIADIQYTPIGITSISNSVGTVEIGSTVKEVTINWQVNKEPISQSVDGESVGVKIRSKTLTGLSLTANKSYEVKVTDEKNTVRKSTTIYFYNGVYYGTIPVDAVINNGTVLGLNKKLRSDRVIEFTATAGVGQRHIYACPSRYGTPTFKDAETALGADFYLASTFLFKNASGYVESYDVWLSTNPELGRLVVSVS